jgi:CheY-like chemotaxis protein
MDIRMPGLDGMETTRRIRQSADGYHALPIIAITDDNDAATHAACMAAGVDLFLTKPLMRNDLIEALVFLRRQSTDIAAALQA